MLRITASTLRRWDKQGKIKTIRTPSGIRLYDREGILGIMHRGGAPIEPVRIKYAYCRVSSKKQADDLKRQEDFYRSDYPDYQLVSDIGSGINFKRKGLQTILERVMLHEVEELVVSHRDRLCRFGFELIEWICLKNDTKLVVLDKDEHQSPNEELADDVLSIIHIFSNRDSGKRRYTSTKNKTNPDNGTANNT
jgi:predicted site-specific integrase-resolvase